MIHAELVVIVSCCWKQQQHWSESCSRWFSDFVVQCNIDDVAGRQSDWCWR